MKEFRYSRWYKIILTVFHQLFTGVLVALIVVGLYYEYRYNGTSDILKSRPFLESNYFGHRIQEEVLEIMDFVDRSERFETKGSYDPEKVVDIIDYVDRNRITGSINSSVGYTVEDLLSWCKAGIEYQSVMVCQREDGTYDYYTLSEYEQKQLQEEIVVQEELEHVYYDEYNREWIGKSSDGEGIIAEEAAIAGEGSDVAEDGDAVDNRAEPAEDAVIYESSWEMEAIVEKYAPRLNNQQPPSLMELADKDPNVNGNLDEYYRYLREAIHKIEGDLLSYKEETDTWNTSNLTFLFQRDGSNVVYTNNSQYTSQSMFQKNVEAMQESGDFIYIDTLNMDMERSEQLALDMRMLYEQIQDQGFARNGDYVLCVQADTSFTIRDELYNAKGQYERMQPWFKVIVAAAFISFIGFLICLAELALVTGKTEKDGEVQLNWFDRIYTEIAFVMTAIVLGILCIPIAEGELFNMLYEEHEGLDFGFWIAVTGGCVLAASLIGLGAYLSLARRLKVKSLWSRSLIGTIIRGVQNGVENRKATTKMFLCYAVFMLFNLLAVVSDTALIFLAVLLDIWVGLILIREAIERSKITEGVTRIAEGNVDYKVDVSGMRGSHNISLGVKVNNIGEGLQNSVEESMKSERLKTDLITNVSHDIKTPLTSIINYVDLLKREDIEDEKIRNYINILEQKSSRLKHLTEDLVEASKISSGNIKLEFEKINFIELVNQTDGEFSEKFAAKNLEVITNVVGPSIHIYADGRRIWRVLENLYNNVAKYAMENTRVYVDVRVERGMMEFSIKNISKFPLNIQADELTERFIRGDVSRSTEGSGLGLSIARNLTELQNGQFEIYLDGDLFKVIIRFPRIN